MKYGSYHTKKPIFYKSNRNNSRTISTFHSSKNISILDILLQKKNKTKKIRPPFGKGLFSYKHSFNSSHNKFIKKLSDNISYNLSSIESPNYFNNKENINYNNYNNNMMENDSKKYKPNYNSSLSFSSINLNKYKISMTSSQNNRSFKGNNYNSYKPYNNNIKNVSITLNNNTNNDSNFIAGKKIYYNFFKDSNIYEKESRRMIVEYLKVIGRLGNKNKYCNFNRTVLDNIISPKILNQKCVENEFNNNDFLDDTKKYIHKNNINHSISSDSVTSNNTIDNNNFKSNKKLNLYKSNNISFFNENKKIDIFNFLWVPRVLNLISGDTKEKYIFLITLDDIFYKEGDENYKFQWRNMTENEIENEINIRQINYCYESPKFNNRFIIKVHNELNQKFYFEIETPSKELCNNYVKGINYLLKQINENYPNKSDINI